MTELLTRAGSEMASASETVTVGEEPKPEMSTSGTDFGYRIATLLQIISADNFLTVSMRVSTILLSKSDIKQKLINNCQHIFNPQNARILKKINS